MNIFHKTQKKETRKLPMTGKVKKGFRYYCAAVLSVTAVFAMSTTAFAASDPLTVVNNLSDFIFGFIRAIGLILLGFGIVHSDKYFYRSVPIRHPCGILHTTNRPARRN